MKTKLKDGDFVKNLSRKQFNKLLIIEKGFLSLTFFVNDDDDEFHNKSLIFQFGSLYHAEKQQSKTELTFEEFLSRAKNTFQS